jgi:hypothetical protein
MICKYCNQEKGDDFPWEIKNGKKYYRKRCTSCYSDSKKQRRHKLKQQYDEIKSQAKCEICGFSDWRALQYHHVDKNNKTLEVSNMVYRGFAMDKIIKEMSKCKCICANCHQIHHHEERKKLKK